MKTPLIERMEKSKAPKTWIAEVAKLKRLLEDRELEVEEYGSIIGTLAPQKEDLLEALEAIAEGKGVYSLDKFTHANNIIENLISIAKQAIAKAKEEA